MLESLLDSSAVRRTARPTTLPPRCLAMRARGWIAGAVLVGCLPATVRAADYGSSLEIGVASEAGENYSSERFVQAAYRYAPATPGMAGIDFTLSTWLPAYMVVVPELDLTYAIPLGRNTFVAPRVGGTLLLAGSGGYSMAVAGANAGIGMVVLGERGNGMRLDVSARRFAGVGDEDRYFWSASVGFVWASQ